MEHDPFISTGMFINHSDPMISIGSKKKDMFIFLLLFEKKMAVYVSIV